MVRHNVITQLRCCFLFICIHFFVCFLVGHIFLFASWSFSLCVFVPGFVFLCILLFESCYLGFIWDTFFALALCVLQVIFGLYNMIQLVNALTLVIPWFSSKFNA